MGSRTVATCLLVDDPPPATPPRCRMRLLDGRATLLLLAGAQSANGQSLCTSRAEDCGPELECWCSFCFGDPCVESAPSPPPSCSPIDQCILSYEFNCVQGRCEWAGVVDGYPPPPRTPPPPMTCVDDEEGCAWLEDGVCDDGGPGSQYASCEYATDCSDCGPRPPPPPPAPPAPPPAPPLSPGEVQLGCDLGHPAVSNDWSWWCNWESSAQYPPDSFNCEWPNVCDDQIASGRWLRQTGNTPCSPYWQHKQCQLTGPHGDHTSVNGFFIYPQSDTQDQTRHSQECRVLAHWPGLSLLLLSHVWRRDGVSLAHGVRRQRVVAAVEQERRPGSRVAQRGRPDPRHDN